MAVTEPESWASHAAGHKDILASISLQGLLG